MIKLKDLLLEKMTFKQLLALSDTGRKNRSKNIDTRSLKVQSDKNSESWIFSYKSSPSTTGKRHQGYIKFLKPDINQNKQALEWNCIVDCTCPDFKFRFAYNTSKQDASIIGNNSWNKNNGRTPLPINNKIGLCKHLISLTDYLKTKISQKSNIKEFNEMLNEITIENRGGILIENSLKDFAKNVKTALELKLKKLEAEYDRRDHIGLSTKDIQDELYQTRKDIDSLNFLLNRE